MDLIPVAHNLERLFDYQELFSVCFPSTAKFSVDYLYWLYCLNPDGSAIGFDAYENGSLVAHYACIPGQALINNSSARVILSLNTATHPAYQGRGLFSRLANLTYELGAGMGYDCVYGVANQNSTPGFIRKLGFQLVMPLEAKIGVGPLGLEFPFSNDVQFQRVWSADALNWRCSSPANKLCLQVKDKITQITGIAGLRGALSAIAETDLAQSASLAGAADHMPVYSPLRLFLGHLPFGLKLPLWYVSIPQRLRPSPLNLIYRSLNSPLQSLDEDACFITFIDFDAF